MRTSPFMGQPHSTDQCRCLPNSQHLPESLTRRVVVRPFAPLSRGWPASPRNGGGLQFGTVAGIKSESRPASNRNTWPECVGICILCYVHVRDEFLAPSDHLEFALKLLRYISSAPYSHDSVGV